MKNKYISNIFKIGVIFLIIFNLTNCRKNNGEIEDICNNIDKILYGKINGNDFNFNSGVFEENLIDTNFYWVYLFGNAYTQSDTCDIFELSKYNYIKAKLPKKKGNYLLKNRSDVSITFVNKSSYPVINTILIDGEIDIIHIDSNIIEASICSKKDNNNYIVGKFIVYKCHL